MVNVGGNAQEGLTWTFNLVVPFSNIQSTLSRFSNLQQSFVGRGQNSITSFSFYETGLQTSAATQALQPCSYSGLVSDARAQAMNLAGSAGLPLGPIVAVSDGSTGSGVVGGANVPVFAAVYSLVAFSGVFYSAPASTPSAACTLTVQFDTTGKGATAQGQPGSITVTGSVNTTAASDQALFYVSVAAPINMTLDDVLAEIAGSGITAGDLSSQSQLELYLPGNVSGAQAPTVSWPFNLSVPFSSLQQTISTLTALQTKIGNVSGQPGLNFYVEGLQTSSQALAAQTCSATDVLNNARAKAQSIATAAGLSLGSAVALSNVAEFSGCTATVKFAATRGQ